MKFLHDENLVFVEGFGRLTVKDVKNTIQEFYEITEKFPSKRVLSDHTKVESVPEYIEVFNLGSLVGHALQDIKIAIIYHEEFREDYKLFEQSVNKRGGNLKLFEDKEQALRWLNSVL